MKKEEITDKNEIKERLIFPQMVSLSLWWISVQGDAFFGTQLPSHLLGQRLGNLGKGDSRTPRNNQYPSFGQNNSMLP
jgi:hypothetical protein